MSTIDELESTEWHDMRYGMMPPDGLVVMTKIDDHRGVRNEQPLKRWRNLWFVPEGDTYVYYTPSHWRYIA